MIGNNPVDKWYYLGLKDKYGCCTDDLINKGRAELELKYERTMKEPERRNYGTGMRGRGSCKNTSFNTLDSFGTWPKCWDCNLERRLGNRKVLLAVRRNDHQVITCKAYCPSGDLKGEVVFDFWGGVSVVNHLKILELNTPSHRRRSTLIQMTLAIHATTRFLSQPTRFPDGTRHCLNVESHESRPNLV